MNIALIIFPIHASHGCILQTFALATTLRQMGHKVTIIDRQWDKLSYLRVCLHAAKIVAKKIVCGYEGGFNISVENKLIMSELQTFIDRYLHDRVISYSTPSYTKLKDFDAFIVGSDQTWRPKYVSDATYYYLGFIPSNAKVKRVAYAPSFGTEEWEYSPELTETCKELIQRFDAVSVREESGIKLCKVHYNIEATHVLDPTMLLHKEDYLSACGLELRNDSELSYYLLDSSDEKMAIVNKVCTDLNLRKNRINTDTENSKASLHKRIAPSIEKWIGGFAHSKFIVADSFHATVFAILFNKPFITIANKERGLARFMSLLQMVGLENRLVFDSKEVDDNLITSTIEWNEVNKRLANKRTESLTFLKNSLA